MSVLSLALVPILMGSGLAMQTAVNSKLRQAVGSPYLASAVSFSVGALFLLGITGMTGGSLGISWQVISQNPWWIWSGGVLGVIGLTVNLLLFPRLGSLQTAVLPIFGQIVMGLIIDQFGLFSSPQTALTWLRGGGLVLVTGGMLVATGLLEKRSVTTATRGKWLWQGLGIGAGMLMATQTAINGHLGVVLGSSLHAALISFSVGAVLLILVVIGGRLSLSGFRTTDATSRHNWWQWLGGFLGALYVYGSSWLVPQIGTGQVVVLALFGQLLFSALIDQFGWFEAVINRVALSRLVGLVALFLGVLSVHFL
ncbi:membrane protein [Levilactobacillus acidifarinae]|nr:membrane protein [Levilactobacillus acidifarinae]